MLSVLEWAREESGYDPEQAAKRAGVPAQKLLAWEHGDAKPTLRQAQALARFYHRALGIFSAEAADAATACGGIPPSAGC